MSWTKTVPNVNWLPGLRPHKILLAVMPYEGEVRDKVTDKFYKNSAVKYMPLGVLSIAACIPDCYEVKVLDAASRGLTLEETITEIEAFAHAEPVHDGFQIGFGDVHRHHVGDMTGEVQP